MKKTIWIPLVIGAAFGLLAGISMSAQLTFVTPAGWIIGFFGIFWSIAAALGGPLAGFLAVAISVVICTLFGYPELKAIFSLPLVFWANIIIIGAAFAVEGFLYRLAYTHTKMPFRLLPWVGIVAFGYLVGTPLLVTVEILLGLPFGNTIWEGITVGVKGYLPQQLFDIVFTER